MGGANTQFVTSLVLPLGLFVTFSICPGHTAGPIATLNGSYDAVSAEEVAFVGLNGSKINV